MKERIIKLRNIIIRFIYIGILKPIFFQIDPEKVHDRILVFGKFFGTNVIMRRFVKLLFYYSHPSLKQEILGINFSNPIGLAAGFDKNAELTNILPPVGFGFVEVGSITGDACDGNPKPRLWRLIKSKSLVVYYGLKNDGAEVIANRLRNKRFSVPIGISIAKTNNEKTVGLDAGINDYLKAYEEFSEIGAYYTINISCPNTFGGQPFTDSISLEKLLVKIDKVKKSKPIFLKLSPDISRPQIDEILMLVKNYKIDGFICTNLTKQRDNYFIRDDNVSEQGGISGKAVAELSNELIKYIYKKTNGEYVIIGVGGVFTADDAYKKIRLGASLVQLITGMIFQGPQSISEINQGLVELLKRDGFNSIKEAIGVDNI